MEAQFQRQGISGLLLRRSTFSWLLCGVLFMALTSCGSGDSGDIDGGWDNGGGSRKDTTLTVMAYNIHAGCPNGTSLSSVNVNMNNAATVIKRYKAEVVLVNEIHIRTSTSGSTLDQVARLAELAEMPYYYFARSRYYGGGELGNAIFSKYPLSDTRTDTLKYRVDLSAGSQYYADVSFGTATVTKQGKQCRVGVTHLGLQASNNERHAQKIVYEYLADPQIPVIVGGDLNTQPSQPAAMYFKQQYTSSLPISAYTFPAGLPTSQIDYLFYGPIAMNKLSLVEAKVCTGELASDHLPVLAKYKFK